MPPISETPTPRLQTKLEIGPANDKYEQEAERVAEQVVRMPDSTVADSEEDFASAPPMLQRLCAECEEEEQIQRKCTECEEEETVQRQCAECEEEETVQRQAMDEEEELIQSKRGSGGRAPAVTPAVASDLGRLRRGGGRPLAASTRAFFEPRFGNDFSGVRVHTGDAAGALSRRLNARAFTVGNDVFFDQGEYRPQTPSGLELLAHELTHTVQQTEGAPSKARLPGAGQDHASAVRCAPAAADPSCSESPAEPRPPTPDDFNLEPTLAAIRANSLDNNDDLLVAGFFHDSLAVALVQQAIFAWGCEVLGEDILAVSGETGGMDGDFGGETRAAVETFQSHNRDVEDLPLVKDGIVGPRTLSALDAFVSARAPGPPPIAAIGGPREIEPGGSAKIVALTADGETAAPPVVWELLEGPDGTMLAEGETAAEQALTVPPTAEPGSGPEIVIEASRPDAGEPASLAIEVVAPTIDPKNDPKNDPPPSRCVTPFAITTPSLPVTDRQNPDPVAAFAQSPKSVIGADSLAVHTAALKVIPTGSNSASTHGLPRKAKKLADILSGPAKSDVIVHKQGRRFAAWFDCAALPRNISGSVIREPIPPSQVGADKVWSGKASGADLRDKGKTVWSVFPGAKDLVQNLPPGDAILEIRDPGGKVSQTLAPHEEAHAKAWKKAFEDVIRKWTRDVASHAKQADAVESGTKALARAKLFRTVGGSKRRIARKTLRAKGKADKVVDQKKGITFTISRIQTRVGGGKSRVTIFIKPR